MSMDLVMWLILMLCMWIFFKMLLWMVLFLKWSVWLRFGLFIM